VLVLTAVLLVQSKLPKSLCYMAKKKATSDSGGGLLLLWPQHESAGPWLGINHFNVNAGNAVRQITENDSEGD